MDASRKIDRASPAEARTLLARCCGSTRWVEQMLLARPFGTGERLLTLARTVWAALAPADWREAFSHHPAIGDRAALRARFPATAHLSAREQRGVAGASDATLDALAAGNRAYVQRFGYTFIVCASGKTADEMLALLHSRLPNDPEVELRIAAAEQMKITELRLQDP